MFDRYEIAPAYPQRVTITENRAPTDESVRLAKDYEERAWQAVKDVLILRLEPIRLEAVAVNVEYSFQSIGNTTHFIFTLNGRQHDIRIEDTVELFKSPEKAHIVMAKALADTIALDMAKYSIFIRKLK